MKLAAAVVAVAVAASGAAEARQMHAGLDYHRYLAEKNETRSEVDEWKAKFGDMAKANGLMPPRRNSSLGSSEERSIDDEDEDEDEIEDHMQRFFMTKQNITAMQALNPNANFSTDSPFSLMTNDEFSTWVGNAYRIFNSSSLGSGSSWLSSMSTGGSSASSRRLRSGHHSSSHRSSSTTTTTYGGTAGGNSSPSTTTSKTTSGTSGTGTYTTSETTVTSTTTTSGTGGTHTSTTTTTTTSSSPGEEHTTVTTTSSSGSSTGKTNTASAISRTSDGASSMLSSLMSKMSGGFGFGGLSTIENAGTVMPAGASDSAWSSTWPSGWSDTSSSTTSTTATTTAPTATTTAPTATTASPTPTPTTATPTPTTAAPTTTPTPTTATPTTTESTSSASTTTVESTDSTSSVASDSDSVDWTDSDCMSPIQSQGSCGNCWAFSTVSAVETAQCIANGQTGLTKYSEQQPTSCDTQNYGCSGGAPVYAMEYIQENGLCTEDDYPYTSSEGTAASCVTGCSAVDTGITGYEKLDDESGLVARVAKQPVVVAVASGNTVWKQYTGGVVSSCDTSSLDHAVVVVGYSDSEWKIRNSWGDSWGEDGYIRLERTSDSTGTCGMYEDMSYPTFDL